MNIVELIVLALAVARLSRLITQDSFPPIANVRNRILRRWPNVETVFADNQVTKTGKDTLGYSTGTVGSVQVFKAGEGWYASEPKAWSEVVTCTWCSSIYVGIAVWGLYLAYPVTVVVAVPFAFSQIAGLLND